MNKIIYAVVAVAVLCIVAVLLFGNNPVPASQGTTSISSSIQPSTSVAVTSTTNIAVTSSTSVAVNSSTSIAASSSANVSYNNSTAITPPTCSSLTGYGCVQITCTPVNSTFTCTNATYAYSQKNGTTYLWVTVGQKTKTSWSSFGVAFVPNGTTMSQGVPQNIEYNVADSQSSSNVGTSLQNGTNATVKADNGMSGESYGLNVSGTIWVCYVNSRTLYVGVGCTTSGGSPATYVEVGKITTV